jgi:hypothetical protein
VLFDTSDTPGAPANTVEHGSLHAIFHKNVVDYNSPFGGFACTILAGSLSAATFRA